MGPIRLNTGDLLVTRFFLKVLIGFTILSLSLGLGCIQELSRPANVPISEITIPTATPVVIVKYIDRPAVAPTNAPLVSPTKAPTVTPTLFPTVTPTPAVDMLEIFEPEEGAIVRDNILVVHGKAYPGSDITVNDSNVVADERGHFWKGIMLKTGDNTINILVSSENQVKAKAIRHVNLLSRQPIFLSVREPLNQSLALTQKIPVSGLTSPDAKITVQGFDVPVKVRQTPDLPVKELGVFNTEVSLSIGTNNIEIIASNTIGQIIKTDRVVAYLP